MSKTATQQRLHIGFFGRTNTGKSTLMNLLTGQETSIISPLPGTTTDPIRKTIELPEVGPVVLIDTAGLNDNTELGEKRSAKSENEIAKMDLAILLFSHNTWNQPEQRLVDLFNKIELPYILLHNQFNDEVLLPNSNPEAYNINLIPSDTQEAQATLVSLIKKSLPENPFQKKSLLADSITQNDHILLITPIDESAPEGRLILPQVQTIRDILDNNAFVSVIQETELGAWMQAGFPEPHLVITDSQAFHEVNKQIPAHWNLTSFSILLARHQGPFSDYLLGTPKIGELQNDDTVLILESCSHHITCNDIGRVKIPNLLQKTTGKKLNFEFVSGLDPLPEDLSRFSLVIQCGGCMVTPRQLKTRLLAIQEAKIPLSNFGMALAYCTGIFKKATSYFLP